jgi:hypothetical protein
MALFMHTSFYKPGDWYESCPTLKEIKLGETLKSVFIQGSVTVFEAPSLVEAEKMMGMQPKPPIDPAKQAKHCNQCGYWHVPGAKCVSPKKR